MTLAEASRPVLTPAEARSELAAEWASRAPSTPAEIHRFYVESEHLEADLDAFHADPERRRWTDIVVHVATTQPITSIVDIGCGAGHDLKTLLNDVPGIMVSGVEPNDALRHGFVQWVYDAGFTNRLESVVEDVARAPIETADLLLCFDVLEHVVDPEAFLTGIATRAKIGCLLIETVATFDCGTPLHLRENRGWHPGHALEAAGWEKIDQSDRLRIWKRFREAVEPRASLIVCAYRSVSIPTLTSLLKMAQDYQQTGIRVTIGGEAGINRSRSIRASIWLRETADDVFLMVDDDIVFTPEQAYRIIQTVRDGHDIVCGAYPVRDGGHLALRGHGGTVEFGAAVPPKAIRHGATGFMAVHRRVLEAMVPTLKLCHGNQAWAFYPFFDFLVIEDEAAGGHNYLSEDWFFCERAAELGFSTWVDPTIILGHLATIELNVLNMSAISAALRGEGHAKPEPEA